MELQNDEQTKINDYQSLTLTGAGHYTKMRVDSNAGVVLIISGYGVYYMVEHVRLTGNSLEFVRGWCETGETPEHAAIREENEEAGITAEQIGHVQALGSVILDNSWINQRIYFVSIELNDQVNLETQLKQRTEQHEGLGKIVKIPREDLPAVIAGTSDSYTLMAYAKLKL